MSALPLLLAQGDDGGGAGGGIGAMLVLLIELGLIVLTFAGLWGVPFLTTQYGFGTRAAAFTMSAMLIAWAAGGLAFAWISERVGGRKRPIAAGLGLTASLWAIIVFVPGLPRAALLCVLLGVCFAAGAAMLSFPLAKESVPPRLAGTVGGIANMGMMLGGMLMQPLVGLVLDHHWDGSMAGGMRLYAFEAYRDAFASMLVWTALAVGALFLIRERREPL